MQKMKVNHYPLSDGAKAIVILAFIIEIIATFLFINSNMYQNAPSLLIIPFIFLAVFAIIVVVLRFRYVLLESYPYLVNLPAFAYRLGIQKNSKTAGMVINRVFTVHALAALYTSVLYLILTTATVQQSSHFVLLAIFALVIVFVATVFIQYRRIYRSFAKR